MRCFSGVFPEDLLETGSSFPRAGSEMLLVSAHRPHLRSPPSEPPRAGATGPYGPSGAVSSRWRPVKAAARSLSSCCLQAGSSVPTLVWLQNSGWCVVTLPQSEALSPATPAAVPPSLPILPARMLCCSCTHRPGGIGPGMVYPDPRAAAVSCAGRALCFNSVIIRETESHQDKYHQCYSLRVP